VSRRLLPGGALLAVLALLAGCGRKAEPLPPIIEVPETTTDLSARQEEREARLEWSFPTLTRAGRPLTDLARVEVFRLAVPPGQEQVTNPDLKRQLMLARGKVIARLEGASLDAATHGGKLVYRDPLPDVPAGTTPPTIWYAVRSRRRDGTPSALSNIISGKVQPVPPPISGLAAVAAKDGITLTWDAQEGFSYVVERRESGAASWDLLTSTELTEPKLVDTSAAQGKTWQYRVRASKIYVWGPPTAPVAVPYPDIYPPPPPVAFVCLPEPGRVVLRWEPSPESGVRYRVERRVGDAGTWVRLADGVTGNEVIDSAPPSGDVNYVVKAVDDAGNESEAVSCAVRMTS
jgi:hypothetical protein